MKGILKAASAFRGGTRPDPTTIVTLVDQLRGDYLQAQGHARLALDYYRTLGQSAWERVL